MEDSISCSPGNSGKKSRSRRFHKNPRKKLAQSIAKYNIDENEIPKEQSYLEALYEESTLSETLNTTSQFQYFNPFENEKLLAAADRAEASTSRSRMQNLTSKGFVCLESKQFEEDHKTYSMQPPQCPPLLQPVVTPKSPHVLGPQTQFGITESEFVRFCDDVEFDVLPQSQSDDKFHKIAEVIECKVEQKTPAKSMSVVEEILKDFCGSPTESEIEEEKEEKTPNSAPKFLKQTKSIVDEILEDFCGSPYSDCSPKANSEDSTPIFRFKEQPIRTYSGLRKKRLLARRNIASDLNVFTSKDDGNTSDSSSGLSVQEDFSQSVVPQLDTVDLNKSVKLCENLLNLSSYFSQLSSSSSKKDNSPPAVVVEDKKDVRLDAIVDEIIKLKSKPLRVNWNKNEREFRGFTDFENDSHESTLQELLEDEDDVLQLINCDSLCYEKVEPKSSLTHVESDLENTLKNASAMIENAKALLLSDIGVNQQPQDLINKSKLNCDTYEEIQTKESPTASFKDEQLFDEIDIWNDNECLLNYKTQKPHPIHEENDLYDNHVDNKKLDGYEQITDPCSSVSLNLLKNSNQFSRIPSRENFKTKKKNAAECKKEEKEDFTANDPFSNQKFITNESHSDEKSFNKLSSCNFQGFATASRKPIAISDTAKKKADEFLKKFEQQDLEQRIEVTETDFSKESSTSTKQPVLKPLDVVPKLDHISRNPLGNKQTNDLPPSNSTPNSISNDNGYVGFSTASKKPISISSKAKQKADNILKKFEQDEQEKRMLESETTSQIVDNKKQEESVSLRKVEDNFKDSSFVGFSTASEKPIAISLEAKRKADEILKKFEQVEKIEEETNERLTQRHPNEVSEEVRRKAQELLLDIEFFEEAFEDELKEIEAVPVSQVHAEKHVSQIIEVSIVKVPAQPPNEQIFNGFQTASKKSIHISKEARQRAENFLKEVYNEDLPQEFLKCIETENNETNYVNNNPLRNSIGIVEQVDGAPTSPRHHHHDVLNKDAEHMHVTNGSGTKNDVDRRQFDSAFKRLHEQNEDCFKDKRSHSEEYDQIQNIKSRKRKHSEGLELDKSFSLITTPRRLSCGERTPLNRIENGLLAKSSSLPSKEYNPKSALISRKNLLSLNKRKKSDSPGQRLESIAGPKTPEKVQHLSHIHNAASSTPNLKGFFDLVSTSTPRLVRNDTTNRTNQIPSKETIDSDFRQIQWEDSNNSFRINRTGCADELNVTFSEVSPSPKQRIEVLKMYGEPPPISPILMLNKCRPSGLRRGRSLMKP